MREEHASKAIEAAELVRRVHAKYVDDPLVKEMHDALWSAVKPWSQLMDKNQFIALGGGTPKTED